MKRMLTVALLPLSALTASFAQALGLGELTLNSSLNQQLEAEIRLINAKAMSDDEIIASLASQQDFARAGIERVFFLTDLDFEVRTSPQGDPIITVSSQKQVKEPFLNFLVEVNWPNGRLLREYTVLLDPPVFDEETAVVDVQEPTSVEELPPIGSLASEDSFRDIPATGESDNNVSVDDLFEQLEEVDLTSEAEELGFTDVSPSVSTYRVKDNDTLWQIAVKVKPTRELSTQQTMLALQDLNPDAFINNNINLLKKNQVLRVPSESDVSSRSKREAFSQVKSQNKILAQQAAAQEFAQLDGTLRDAGDTGAATDQLDGELKLVSPGSVDNIAAESASGDPGKGQTGQEALARLRTTLSVNQENLDKANRENTELRERLEDLEAQIETLQSLISLKDNQMSALQAALSGDSQSASDNRGVPEPVNAASPNGVDDLDDPFRQAPPESSFFQNLLKDPRMFGGLIAAIFVVLSMLFFLSRNSLRREKAYQQSLMDEVTDNDFNNSDEINLNNDDFGSFRNNVAEVDEGTDGNVNLGNSFGFGEEIEAKSDVISEASIYISYGRTEQALQLLNSAIEQEPERADLRLKLMEVFASTNDVDSFDEQLQAVQAIGDPEAIQQALEMSNKLYGEDDELSNSGDLDIAGLDVDVDGIDTAPKASVNKRQQQDVNNEILMDDSQDFSLDDLDLDELDDHSNKAAVERDDEVVFDIDVEDDNRHSKVDVDDDVLNFDLDDDKSFAAGGTLDGDSTRLDFSSSTVAQSSSDAQPINSDNDPYDLDDLMLDSSSQLDSISLDESDSLGTTNKQAGLSGADSIPVDADLDQVGGDQLDDADLDDDFDFLVGTDEAATKLDLARAYIDMDDRDGARDILDEVAREGNDEQRREAAELLKRIA